MSLEILDHEISKLTCALIRFIIFAFTYMMSPNSEFRNSTITINDDIYYNSIKSCVIVKGFNNL